MSNDLPGALQRLARSIAEIAQTRVALLANDVELLGWRLLQFALLAALLLASAAFALLASSALVVIYFWESHRLLATACVTGFYVLLAALAAVRLARLARDRSRPFEGTLTALERDRAAIGG